METHRTFELASLGDRFIALIVDTLIVSMVGGIVGIGGSAIWGGGALSFILGVGYQWYFLTQQNGQTPGKMLMKIRVIKTDGTRITDADAMLRYVGYWINSTLAMLGWVWAAIDSKNQGWHDKIANTYVVKVEAEDESLVDVYASDEKSKRKNDYV